ncbi:glycosyltransferase family 2 protein [Bacillus sp. A116_S68]|nr:glycosyltransferase family 2 protein [Bacillus sp. A116_S68]
MTIEKAPQVTVITPAFNSEAFIKNTIISVKQQTYKDWEMIIVDDFSTDNTVEIINAFLLEDERIKLIRLKENKGAAYARNEAIKNARGRYLAFLDSDDEWFPEKLEQQLEFMHSRDIAFSYTNYVHINTDGRVVGYNNKIPLEVNYKQLLKSNEIGCLTVIIDLLKTGPVQMPDMRSRQDYGLWLELTKKGFKAYGIPKELAKYRIVKKSLSSNKLKMGKQNWKIYREYEKLNLVKSLWYFINYVCIKIRKKMIIATSKRFIGNRRCQK